MEDLEELIKHRREKVWLMKKDGDNSHELLTSLYNNPTHFITELLQNAEDEGAKNVKFELKENELIFSHDSERLFDFNDIKAISNFGDNQEKKEKTNVIGRHGIGFKSVYSITDKPRIISGEFDITIHDFNIPERSNGYRPEFYDGTKIILPFKSVQKEEVYQLLNTELKDLNLNYLLFLSNIQKIEWKTKSEEGKYDKVKNNEDKRFVNLKSSKLSEEFRYLVLEHNVNIDDKNLSIKLAFRLDEENWKIRPIDASPLFVFFPTKIETSLNFLVHAPYYTTPSRENIQVKDYSVVEDDHRNEKLTQELRHLLMKGITEIKELELLDVDFLNILPIEKSKTYRSFIYKALFEATKLKLETNESLLPNTDGSFSSVYNSMLLGSSYLADLLTREQSKILFERSFWLSKEITADKNKTRILRNYLYYTLNIPEYELVDLAAKIDGNFLEQQSDDWLIRFYKTIYNAPALWRNRSSYSYSFRNKPIIRIEKDGKTAHKTPFQNDGKPNVFLPSEDNTNYPTVKRNIANNEDAKKFFEDLGLTKPDVFAEINEFIIPKFRNGVLYDNYFKDFKKVLKAIQKSDNSKRQKLKEDLKNYPFILGYNVESGITKLLKPNEVYFHTEALKTYFENNPNAFFVAEQQYALSNEEENLLHSFLKEIGVQKYPYRIEFQAKKSPEDKRNLRNGGDCSREYFCKDYDLDGLENFFDKEITLYRSIALWEILNEVINSFTGNKKRFFQGVYSYKYYRDFKVYFNAHFLTKLRETRWLIKDGNKYLPSEISYSSLPNDYPKNYSNLELMKEILNFKLDSIEEIEQSGYYKVLTKKEYEELLKKADENNEEEVKENNSDDPVQKFNPKIPADQAKIEIEDFQHNNFGSNRENSQVNSKKNENQVQSNQQSSNNENRKNKESVNQKYLVDIGKWGQDYVANALISEFNTESYKIEDLNKEGKQGVGCDFLVKKNQQIIRMVEVKSTTEELGHTLSISGTQWKVAQNYFNESDGDKYWIYCVFNAGTEKAKIRRIQNPIKKWKEGKLFAHPINFIINEED